jgi:hypothetical protein
MKQGNVVNKIVGNDRKGKLFLHQRPPFALLLVFILLFACSQNGHVIAYNTYEGILHKISFQHPMNKEILPAYILTLQKTIHFPGDEFQERSDVTEVQLVWPFDRYDVNEYIGKQVRVQGTLFGAHTAYHIRNVLVNVDKVEIIE